jgi:hypothetical protein
MGKYPVTRTFIELNPRFRITRQSYPPNIQTGQMTFICDALIDSFPYAIELTTLAVKCNKNDQYVQRYRNKQTNIYKSILYHLNRIDSVELIA